jgi:hypothetical protein
MDSFKAFKEKLDQEHKWPDMYVFKFVVPVGKATEFKAEFKNEAFQEKKSKAGNYISFTLKKKLQSSDEVVEMYLQARKIEGIIAL